MTARAEELPFPDASFDVVTCQTVLIHVADAQVAIGEMARTLRPGGILIAAEPDNLAGNVALLGSSLETSDEDLLAIVALLTACQRGKRALGEGDERVGHRLPQLLANAGLSALLNLQGAFRKGPSLRRRSLLRSPETGALRRLLALNHSTFSK